MKNGEFPDGSRVLRAKIDMASPNLNMRDPVMYRILHATHHRTGDEWCIYPMYDYAHGQSDSIEHVTHSMCTLEFADHQPLYRWYIEQLGIFPSQQIEFDRLNLTYTLLCKRKLLQLVQEKRVSGWDDPRMPTLSGIPPPRLYAGGDPRLLSPRSAPRAPTACTDIEMLEHFQRDDLNHRAARAMAVLHPLKLVIDNYPEGKEEFVEVANNPEDPSAGTRQVPFSREIYIEQDDFREVPPPKYYRLSPGKEVRLRNAYFVTAQSVVKDAARQHRRGALHLRSGQPRRQLARRPQGEVDHALGLGRARHLGRNSPLRQAVLQARSLRFRGRRQTFSTISIPTRSKC